MEPLRAPKTPLPVRYDPKSIGRLPAFWRGALATRESLDADSARTAIVTRLLAETEAGRDPTASEDYKTWLAQRK